MKKWRFLPHTADVRLLVEASSLPEFYAASLLAMNEILHENFCIDESNFEIIEEVSLHSVDPTALLIDFLSDILTLSHQFKALFCKISIITLDNTYIQAKVYGKRVGEFYDDIKAVTYHEAELKLNSTGNWESIIIFDI